MRAAAIALSFIGLIAVVVGTFSGCSALFSWNGRHAVDAYALDPALADGPESGRPTVRTFAPKTGRRYTVAVRMVFDRESVPTRDGLFVVEAKMPLVVRVKDRAGTSLAEVVGWLDPSEPPNVLYGQNTHARPPTELVVERLIGPFGASSTDPLSVEAYVGPDRVGGARVLERRLVIYDDALPTSMWKAFLVAGVGALAVLAGLSLVVLRWWRRRGAPKRGGIPRDKMV